MQEKIILMLLIGGLGIISSGIGGFLGGIITLKTKRGMAMLFEVTAGMMTGIVCFDMLPESFKIANVWYSMFGVIIGISIIYYLNKTVEKINNKKNNKVYSTTSIVIMLAMAIHNMIEGLAIGSGFVFSIHLGISILISIFLHDIPEGMVVGMTNKVDHKKIGKVTLNGMIVGGCSGIGALLGSIIGEISNVWICLSLSFAAGAMLYIVACDLIPTSKNMSKSKLASVTYILGILIGAIITI